MTLTPAEVQFLADALQTFKRNRLTDARKVPSAASDLHAASEETEALIAAMETDR